MPTHLKADPAEPQLSIPEYTQRVLAMLEESASWPNKLAKTLARDDRIDTSRAKFVVSKALHLLQKEGRIDRQIIKLEKSEVMLYYIKDPAMSGLHKFMEREVTKQLEERGITYELAKPGEDKADIMTKDFDVEIETGLKKDLTEFKERLAKATKKTYVVVPDEVEKERYSKINIARVMILSEYCKDIIGKNQ